MLEVVEVSPAPMGLASDKSIPARGPKEASQNGDRKSGPNKRGSYRESEKAVRKGIPKEGSEKVVRKKESVRPDSSSLRSRIPYPWDGERRTANPQPWDGCRTSPNPGRSGNWNLPPWIPFGRVHGYGLEKGIRKGGPKKGSEKAIPKGNPKRKSKKAEVRSVEGGRDTPPAMGGQLWDQPQHAVGEE